MRRVVERVERDAAALERPRQLRVPGQHDVHGVAARGEAARDRLHEGAVDVAREARVRRRDHDDGLGHRARYAPLDAVRRVYVRRVARRSTTRHGM